MTLAKPDTYLKREILILHFRYFTKRMDSRIDNPGDSIHHVLAYLDGPENTSVKEYCDIHGCAHGTILARMSKLRKKARESAGIPPPGLNVAQTARLLSRIIMDLPRTIMIIITCKLLVNALLV